MSFDSIEWIIPDFRVAGAAQSGGLDVHVIFSGKPTTLELGDRLVINFTEGGVKKRLAARLFNPPDTRIPELTSLVFNSIFPFTLARHGAEVGVKGQLKVAATRPAGTPLRNFIVEAIAFFGDGRANQRFYIRVHLHDARVRTWLSPRRLTLRPRAQLVKFTIFMEFSDGVVGNVTDTPGIIWGAPDQDPNFARIDIGSDGGVLLTAGDTSLIDPDRFYPIIKLPDALGGDTLDETTPPAQLGGGRISIGDAWPTFAPGLTILDGPNKFAKTPKARWREIPNVLLLPDGFEKEADFTAATEGIADFIHTTPEIFPFFRRTAPGQPNGIINLFRCWVPSREPGTSIIFPVDRSGKGDAKPLPQPRNPTGGGTVTTLRHLLYRVGFPVPTGDPATFNDAYDGWKQLFVDASGATQVETHVGKKTAALEKLWKKWRRLRDYTYMFEPDTAFGLACGHSLAGVTLNIPREINLHELRTTRTDIDRLVEAMTWNGEPVGETWSVTKEGKDQNLVIVIAGTAPDAGLQSEGLIAASLSNATTFRVKAAPGTTRLVDYVAPPDIDPTDMGAAALSTFIHEIGHTFNLGDEYGEFGRAPFGTVTEEWNIQSDSELGRNADGDIFDVSLLRWFLPRIAAAAVLKIDLQPTVHDPQSFIATLWPGHGRALKKTATFRLRARPMFKLEAGSAKYQKPSGRFTITNLGGNRDVFELTPTVRNDPDNQNMLARFKAGSVLLQLVQPESELVQGDIFALLAGTRLPLNKRPAGGSCNQHPNEKKDHPQALIPNLPVKPSRYASRIVGIFDNGQRRFCGVYHPSPACMMRTQTMDVRDDVRYAEFCDVCRYLLVDQIDPRLHKQVEARIAKTYPRAK